MRSDSIFNSQVVTILVGPNKTQYFVHEQALARAEAGEFFNKIFTNGFKEEHTKCLELPEDDADAFRGFVAWLYSECVSPVAASGSTANFVARQGADPDRLLRIYILAHKYMITKLQDVVVSKMYDRMQSSSWPELHFDQDTLEEFLAGVPSSHMHTLLARCIIDSAFEARSRNIDQTELDIMMSRLPDGFVRLMAREMFNINRLVDQLSHGEIWGLKSKYLLKRKAYSVKKALPAK